MSRLFWVRVTLICLSVFFAQQSTMQRAAAQEPSSQDEKKLIPRPPESAANAIQDQRRISIDVLATDASGKAISGLQQQDFTILDNEQPQKMTSFEALQGPTADPPVEVILLIDLVNTTFERVAYERQEIDKYLRQNNGHLAYPVTLVVFSDTGTTIQPQPSRDGNALADLLESSNSSLRIIGRSAGVYGAEERLQTSFNTLDRLVAYEGSKPGRKMVIWVSPGWPLLSGPNIDFSAKQQQEFFTWIASFSNALRTSRITLYAVDPIGGGEGNMMRAFYYQNFLKGVRNAKQANSGNLALQVLATQSGGHVFNGSSDLTAEINACVADASAYYSMSFEAVPADHVNEYHALTVKVGKPGVKVRTNAAYYSQP
jgi:VWFA-related protein